MDSGLSVEWREVWRSDADEGAVMSVLSVARAVYGHRASLCPFSVFLVEKAAESPFWGSGSFVQCGPV